jgi:hypothetical protein
MSSSSSIRVGRVQKGLLGAVAAMALGLAAGGGGSDEPDARVGYPDGGGGPTPDAAVPSTHSGTFSVTDVTALAGDGTTAIAKGGSISISFTPNGTALPGCSGNGAAPCQLGTNPPIGTCFTRILPLNAATPATVDVGPITIGLASRTAGADAAGDTTTTPAFPVCGIRGGQYACISVEGTGGTATPTGGGAGTFSGYTIGDAGTDNNTADVGRTLVAITNNVLNSLPITGVAAGSFTVVTGTLAVALPVNVWRVVHGGGPTPAQTQFLNESDRLSISFPGAAGGATSPFGPRTATPVVVPVGDTFTLSDNTKAIFAKMDDRSEIGAQTAPFTLGCRDVVSPVPGPGDCGSTGVGGVANASGTLVVLEATTGTERIVTQCSALGVEQVTVIATHWDLIKNRANTLTSMQITLFRPGLTQVTETAPRAPNLTNYLAGHGFVGSYKGSTGPTALND